MNISYNITRTVLGGKEVIRQCCRSVAERLAAYANTDLEFEKIQQWIPISDRLPTKEDANAQGMVLVIAEATNYVDIWNWEHVNKVQGLFSYWMPTPKLPEEA
jgi:hypothetical protein